MSRVVFIRFDRLGDLILTLPVENIWKTSRPNDLLSWIVPSSLSFVMKAAGIKFDSLPSKIRFFDKIRGALEVRKFLKELSPDMAVVFHAPWWVTLGVFLAGVSKRVGPSSQWHHFLFLNKRLKQKRSQALQHEAKYNLDLACFALDRSSSGVDLVPFPLVVDSGDLKKVASELSKQKVTGHFVVIHPGMGGSAKNWPLNYYGDLARELMGRGTKVVVTGSFMDRSSIEGSGLLEIPGVVSFVESTSGPELLALLSLSSAVVAPSTGVIHLASSLGKKAIGIYSPVRVQAPTRWAPLGDQCRTLVPDVNCPAALECLGEKCSDYDCMKRIDVKSVATCILEKS